MYINLVPTQQLDSPRSSKMRLPVSRNSSDERPSSATALYQQNEVKFSSICHFVLQNTFDQTCTCTFNCSLFCHFVKEVNEILYPGRVSLLDTKFYSLPI